MYLEFIFYVFIAIGFLSGILRGFRKELFTLISLVCAFALVLFTYKPFIELIRTSYDIRQIYDINFVGKILGLVGITVYGFEYIVVGGLMFIITFAILQAIFKVLLFNAKRVSLGKGKSGNKFLGGLIGLVSGLVLALFFVPFFRANFNGTFDIASEGSLTKLFLQEIPFLSNQLMEMIECILTPRA